MNDTTVLALLIVDLLIIVLLLLICLAGGFRNLRRARDRRNAWNSRHVRRNDNEEHDASHGQVEEGGQEQEQVEVRGGTV